MRRRNFLALGGVWFDTDCGGGRTKDIVPPSPPPALRLLFGGDVMLSRHVGRIARQKQDPSWPFRELAGTLKDADIAFVNLESPFSDKGRRTEKGMVFKADPEMISGLVDAGIDVVSTSNNHARDCGSYGVTFTLEWLAKHGILAVGTGATGEIAHAGVVLERKGVRFGFLAYTYDQLNGNYTDHDPRIAVMDLDRMKQNVQSMKTRSDVIVVSMHAGTEYRRTPHKGQVEFARAAINAGARLVVGHHPHVIQTVEEYGGGLIFYSLGNLVFDQSHRRDTQRGLLAEVIFNGARLDGYYLLPVDIKLTVPRVLEPATEASG
ncbi:MAG: CapA family protein [Bryobacteraceae bacterium]|nr:CapA family protein [Bryobacterales bacterium]MEB2361244.1 CapA family protein [Bryobacterales bacterium]NUN02839.1 CapA family protein [Bryobacteraceae bacterium]